MPRTDYEVRAGRVFNQTCTNIARPVFGTGGRCDACVTPSAVISGCRPLWTPDDGLYRSTLEMPQFTYAGNAGDEYEAIESVGPVNGEDIEIWAESGKYLEQLVIEPDFPDLLWTFQGPLDQDEPSCILARQQEFVIGTSSWTLPSNNPSTTITQWNCSDIAAVGFDSDFAHSDPTTGEHRATLVITHTMDWEPVTASNGPLGYVSERFALRTELQWWEPDISQTYWQSEKLHVQTTALTNDITTGTYFRRQNQNQSLQFVRNIPWSHASVLPSLTVTRRLN